MFCLVYGLTGVCVSLRALLVGRFVLIKLQRSTIDFPLFVCAWRFELMILFKLLFKCMLGGLSLRFECSMPGSQSGVMCAGCLAILKPSCPKVKRDMALASLEVMVVKGAEPCGEAPVSIVTHGVGRSKRVGVMTQNR